MLFCSIAFLTTGCTSKKGLRVKIEIEDSIALDYELKIREEVVVDTIYKLYNKIKLHISPRKASDIVSIMKINLQGKYYSCTGVSNLFVYPIEIIEKDRFVPYNGRNVLTKEDFYYYHYGVFHCIDKEDREIITKYFKRKGKSKDNLIEGGSINEFKRDLPNYYEKYLNNKGDSIEVKFRKVSMFFKSEDYQEGKYIIDYNTPLSEY